MMNRGVDKNRENFFKLLRNRKCSSELDRHAMNAYIERCFVPKSFLLSCRFYLMMSTTEYFICLVANIIPKRLPQYIFFFLSSFCHNIIRSVQDFSLLCQFFFSVSITIAICMQFFRLSTSIKVCVKHG
jgi:hypothetical protein